MEDLCSVFFMAGYKSLTMISHGGSRIVTQEVKNNLSNRLLIKKQNQPQKRCPRIASTDALGIFAHANRHHDTTIPESH